MAATLNSVAAVLDYHKDRAAEGVFPGQPSAELFSTLDLATVTLVKLCPGHFLTLSISDEERTSCQSLYDQTEETPLTEHFSQIYVPVSTVKFTL
jgi:hypothetical protein